MTVITDAKLRNCEISGFAKLRRKTQIIQKRETLTEENSRNGRTKYLRMEKSKKYYIGSFNLKPWKRKKKKNQ